MLISTPENRHYLSGFTGSAGYLLLSQGHAVLVTDSRYTEQATNQAPQYQVLQVRSGWDWLMEWLEETGAKRLGFESQDMTVATYNNLLEALKQHDSLSHVVATAHFKTRGRPADHQGRRRASYAAKSHRCFRRCHGSGVP